MEVRRFRHLTGIKCHWLFALGIGLFWALLHFASSGDYAEWGEEQGELRYVEREILLLEAGRDKGVLLEWWTGQGEREEMVEQLQVILADHLASERVVELRSALATGDEVFSEDEQNAFLRRHFLVGLPWIAAFGGAFFALWMVRRDWKLGGRIWRVTGAWSPLTVLAVAFLAHLLAEYLVYDAAVGWLYLIFGDDWGDLLSSFLWRAGAASIAAFALVGSWSGIKRVFGLGQAIRWRAVVGVFCVVVLYESLQEWVGATSDVVDPSDFFLIAHPRAWDVFYDGMNGVVFAPIFEEVMFRGVLFLGLARRLGPVKSALISSVFFAAVHTQYDAWGMLSTGVFGLGCCWLTWRTGSIKSSIVLHMIYNGLITGWVYVVYQMPL